MNTVRERSLWSEHSISRWVSSRCSCQQMYSFLSSRNLEVLHDHILSFTFDHIAIKCELYLLCHTFCFIWKSNSLETSIEIWTSDDCLSYSSYWSVFLHLHCVFISFSSLIWLFSNVIRKLGNTKLLLRKY